MGRRVNGADMEASRDDVDAAATLAVEAALAQLQETVGDREFVAELIGDFLAGLPAQLGALRAASADGDREQLRRVAHTLKSNAATFGAERLALACGELEHVARSGEGADGHELVGHIEAEAARATPGLTAARDDRSA